MASGGFIFHCICFKIPHFLLFPINKQYLNNKKNPFPKYLFFLVKATNCCSQQSLLVLYFTLLCHVSVDELAPTLVFVNALE